MNTLHRIPSRAIIKVGTDVITTPEGELDMHVMRELSRQIAEVRAQVGRIALVTSGAVAAGRAVLKTKKHAHETVADKQKFAMVGQVPLLLRWSELLKEQGLIAGQILLTGKNFDSRSECQHLQDGLESAFTDSAQIVPVVNENDPIATEELKVSDNDEIAAHLAKIMGAQYVLLLSKISGIQRELGNISSVISEVAAGSHECEQYIVEDATSENGTGGAASKVRVGQELSDVGIQTTVAHGRDYNVIPDVLLKGKRIGTTFFPQEK
jgi:glutamate 5-kinase